MQYYYCDITSTGQYCQYWSHQLLDISYLCYSLNFNPPERPNDSDVQNLPNDK